VTRTVSLKALQAGEQVTVPVGETLRVIVEFDYTVSVDTSMALRVYPYQYTVGVLDRIGSCGGEYTADLPAALTSTHQEVQVDCLMKPAKEGGIANGTYGIIAEVPGTSASFKIDDALVITGNPEDWTDLLAPMLALMALTMMVGMTQSLSAPLTGGKSGG